MENDIATYNSGQTISSVTIAEVTSKRHDHVMRDCRKLNDMCIKLGQPKLGDSKYLSNQNKPMPMFILNGDQFITLIAGYSLELRLKLVIRWRKLEQKFKKEEVKSEFPVPKTLAGALKLAYEIEVEKEKVTLQLAESNEKVEIAEKTIEENKPKVVFAESVSGSSNSILIRQLAKDISDSGFKIGQNQLFNWMRTNKYINYKNEPFQKYINQGLFEVITRLIGSADNSFTSKTTKVTGKGAVYFTNKVKQPK